VVKERAVDLVLLTRLVAVRQEGSYVPPASGLGVGVYAPPAAYSGFYPYYSYSHSVVSSPGYVDERTVLQLETRVYDTRSEKLVWSAISKTFDYSSASDVAESVASALIDALVQAHILP
jgi:hypothetical protein